MKPEPGEPPEPSTPEYNSEMFGLRVAKAWGLTPRQWREQPLDDRKLMMAFEIFEGTVEGYRAEFKEAWRRKKKDKKRGGAANDFDRLKSRLNKT